MKKHLLATLCVGTLLALPGCMGCCDRNRSTETQVDATATVVTPEVEAQATTDAAPAEAAATEETNKF